ncbi:MAG: pentapeptide repeat-containing protein, partial [Kiloniellaceae bacterium]
MSKSSTESDWVKLGNAELKQIIRDHIRFVSAKSGGKRAALQFHDLSALNLAGLDLSRADLTAAKLREAKL